MLEFLCPHCLTLFSDKQDGVGWKIAAIKHVRDLTKWGLKDTKDFVEGNSTRTYVDMFSAMDPMHWASNENELHQEIGRLRRQAETTEEAYYQLNREVLVLHEKLRAVKTVLGLSYVSVGVQLTAIEEIVS